MPAHPAGPRHGDLSVPPGAPPRPTDQGDLNALPTTVWPSSAHRGRDGALVLGGVDVRDAVAQHGSPLFLLDEAHFRANAREYAAAYVDVEAPADVYYASKALLTGTIARWVEQEGLSLDVATGGELELALRAGFPAARILMHGNNKSHAEIERAVAAGVGRIVLDSMVDIARVAAVAEGADQVVDVLIRVTVGVEAHTHEFIATAHEDQKFGLSLAAGEAAEGAARVSALPSLRLVGLHSHIGSQIFDPAGFEMAAGRMVRFMADLKATQGLLIEQLNLGGGMGIAYTEEDDPLDVAAMAAAIRSVVSHECIALGLPLPRLAVEPGRALVGPAGITVYEVGTVKAVDLGSGHRRTYVSVDGGMSDNIRTALYDAQYSVALVSRASTAEPMLVRVVGKHCESGDIVVRDAWLPGDLVPGDLVAVAATGAYCRSMASNYNHLPRPGIVAVAAGESTVVLNRESYDDMFALDPALGRS